MSGSKEEQLKYIYDLGKDRVYNTILSLVKNTHDAEELTQDVFIKAYEKMEDFRGESETSTWLYRIAVNTALDHLRAGKRKKRFAWLTSIFDPDSGEMIHDTSDFVHPGTELEQKENSKFLFKAIDKLPEKQQAAYVLHNIEGLPYKEIAAVLDTSLSSVESLLFRAKQNLKKELLKYFPEKN